MTPGKRVITGIASHWGSELARRLEADPSIDFIAGIDTAEPTGDLERTEFIEADIRNPVLARILPITEPDTVVHCGILWYPEPGKSARALHDINVIGTLQLLAACEKSPTLRSLVVRSSAAIYGCEGAAPSFFSPLRTSMSAAGYLARSFNIRCRTPISTSLTHGHPSCWRSCAPLLS